MKNYIYTLCLILAGLILVGCDDAMVDVPAGPSETARADVEMNESDLLAQLMDGEAAKGFGGITHAESPVYTFADPFGAEVGTSKIFRHKKGVVATLSSDEIAPGTVATFWFVVFNNPEHCIDGCDDPDLFENPAVQADLFYGAGRVAGQAGGANYAALLKVGDKKKSIMSAFGLPSYGLMDAEKAEVHIVIRSHGPRLPGQVREQLRTFNGGCVYDGIPEDPILGEAGPNTCEDILFAVHPPSP